MLPEPQFFHGVLCLLLELLWVGLRTLIAFLVMGAMPFVAINVLERFSRGPRTYGPVVEDTPPPPPCDIPEWKEPRFFVNPVLARAAAYEPPPPSRPHPNHVGWKVRVGSRPAVAEYFLETDVSQRPVCPAPFPCPPIATFAPPTNIVSPFPCAPAKDDRMDVDLVVMDCSEHNPWLVYRTPTQPISFGDEA